MMHAKIGVHLALAFFLLTLAIPGSYAQSPRELNENFNSPGAKFEKTGRGEIAIKQGVLTSKEAYAAFGDPDWKDYEVTFSARTPAVENQVQIWSGFRAAGRNERYILGLRGGIQNDLYLARLGYMGADDHLALRHLDFPLQPGKWYEIKVQVAGNRIKVFLNNETLPRIDVTDPNTALSPSGKVTLGGSWISAEFDNLVIKPLITTAFAGQPVKEYAIKAENKEQKRVQERASYRPIQIRQVTGSRTTVSLNGKWLFLPGYQAGKETEAIDAATDDQNWHVLTVPDFWNPNREWLHGERYNTASKGVADNYYQKEIERCEAYTFDYKKTTVGYYRQWIELPADISRKNFQLHFDAVSKVGEVFVNGKKLAHHIGMFGEFRVDATSAFRPGKNLVVVKVTRDYVTDIKDADLVTDVAVTVPVTNKMLKDLAHGFYGDDPAGIWQPVTLEITDPLRIEDVYIQPTLNGATFEVTLKNYSNIQKAFSVSTTIRGDQEKTALYTAISLNKVSLVAGEERKFTYAVTGLKPRLWSPATPNLYDFSFVVQSAGKEADHLKITSGFKTFEVKGDFFYLNGKQYWLRGGNHTPMSLAPNDTLLANRFTKLMHDGNMMVTRTHTAPYDELWMTASDKNGVGVSYEGQWPWLMIKGSMPDQKLIDLWKTEFFDLMKKYRNHPSLLFWTVNNEMKFYDNDPDFESAKRKMGIISDVVKQMRKIDPSRPVCFDSNYMRSEKKFGKDFFNTIDDGDIDDHHWYVNWYHGSIFSEFKGEWQKSFKNPGRPLISQEFSTGYPSETGHPTRFYTYVHQNPSSLVGSYAYEFQDPAYFLKAQSFITRESAEAIRRTNEKAAGILHFAALTWFSNIYQADKLTPQLTYLQMKKALQPVLVSAELWGRHFYAGEKLPARIYVVNDREDGTDLGVTQLKWSLTSNGQSLARGTQEIPAVPYYGRQWVEPAITIPAHLPGQKLSAKLELQLVENGKVISQNDYEIVLAGKNWLQADNLQSRKIILVDPGKKVSPVLTSAGLNYTASKDVAAAVLQKPELLVLSAVDPVENSGDLAALTAYLRSGGKLLLLNADKIVLSLFPSQVRGIIKENVEVFSMEIPESRVFDGLDPLDTRYFNNNLRENPLAAKGAYQVNRGSGLEQLAAFTKVHGYLEGDVDARKATLDQWRGFPIIKIRDQGTAIASQVLVEKGTTDPVAAKLLMNMIADLLNTP